MNDPVADARALLEARRDLPAPVCESAFGALLAGGIAGEMVEGFLRAFREKGETVEELAAAARAMRRRATAIRCDCPTAVDTCGTGGDGKSTFNVSTAAAIVAASAGATVAKHGNRSNSRASGATEVMTELGIDVDAEPSAVEACLRELRIGYLNAARLHPAMRHVSEARRAVGGRTIFNLLGPLTNPAGVRRQVIGVPEPGLTECIAAVLLRLGSEHVWVVHGDGLCDLTITGPTIVSELREGRITTFEVRPEEVGMRRGDIGALTIRDSAESAAAIEAILEGERGARRDHVLLNAGAALLVSSAAASLSEGVRRAAEAVDSGAARATLDAWRDRCGAGR